MIDELNVDWASLTKADLYTIIKQTEESNAKLRELCKAWRDFAYEIFDECFGEPKLNEDFMALDDRMRELGIEVDG